MKYTKEEILLILENTPYVNELAIQKIKKMTNLTKMNKIFRELCHASKNNSCREQEKIQKKIMKNIDKLGQSLNYSMSNIGDSRATQKGGGEKPLHESLKLMYGGANDVDDEENVSLSHTIALKGLNSFEKKLSDINESISNENTSDEKEKEKAWYKKALNKINPFSSDKKVDLADKTQWNNVLQDNGKALLKELKKNLVEKNINVTQKKL